MLWYHSRLILPADLRHEGNSFTALRWFLASAVMVSHAWDLTQPQRGIDPTVALLSFPISHLAVLLFFTLSGFLVTGSLFKRGVIPFLQARALRLLPGLWVMLLVVPPLLWLAFGTIDWATFAGSPETWRFLLRNAALLGKAYHLPGLFETHPLPSLVNGSLWTIPHEVRCYLVLAALAAVGLTQPRWLCTLVISAGLLVHMLLPGTTVDWFDGSRWLAFSFFIGVLAWLWRDILPLSWPLAVACVAVALLLPPGTFGKETLLQTAFAYLALLIAFRIPESWKAMSARMPDYSYGIYIYAFPAQQAALAMGATTPLANLGLAFAMTLPMAALSWHLVEKPALRFKTGKTLPEAATPHP